MAASLDLFDLILHADGRCEAAEEEPTGLQDSPRSVQHGGKVLVVAGEVEDGAADDYVREGVVKGRPRPAPRGNLAREAEAPGTRPDRAVGDGLPFGVGGIDLIALSQHVDEVAARAAAGIEDAHAGSDASVQQLVEEVDVDLAELLLEGGHGSAYKASMACKRPCGLKPHVLCGFGGTAKAVPFQSLILPRFVAGLALGNAGPGFAQGFVVFQVSSSAADETWGTR